MLSPVRHATLRLLRIAVAVSSLPFGSVERADQRTSADDARAAVSLASGADPDDLLPGGQWDPPTGDRSYDCCLHCSCPADADGHPVPCRQCLHPLRRTADQQVARDMAAAAARGGER